MKKILIGLLIALLVGPAIENTIKKIKFAMIKEWSDRRRQPA